MQTNVESLIQRRHGTRIRAQIPLRITSLDPTHSFSENCHTMMVNPQGCGIRFRRALKAGIRVRLDGLPGGRCATARVACSLPPGSGEKFWTIGIGLEAPGNYWCIAPTPADWDGTASA